MKEDIPAGPLTTPEMRSGPRRGVVERSERRRLGGVESRGRDEKGRGLGGWGLTRKHGAVSEGGGEVF